MMGEYKDSEYDCVNCDVLDALCRRASMKSGKKTMKIIELRQRAEAAERVVEVARRHEHADDFLLLLEALEVYDKEQSRED